ncbi:MAG: 5'-methylthioadenosine/S-adenosylhomocysteine nucleosidase [Gomphosphaeria aponina SAG 52.96 = DSM 107014]|uniref:5'-methylthioadenosine/S-adenosylhomocysteine nucleosidase n=1 Tax=Gomphosphaeria aponina SAG 52.96 = DSM 107014 TaxID=1521640 RepID=A0A941JUV7_9CHRO|nr:5'-methylthioadenosine/S-adenosylhomocysteine nucleosidase [Gomphosphaeria aponina SAG 52.96 = DSM 107014]
MPCAVILTALSVERKAVRSHLTELNEETHPQGTIYERGKFATEGKVWDVGIVETGAGNSPAGIEAERAIAYFNPDVILFVGVAGGIKNVILGDVVAGTKVYGYESGKVGETFKPRPDVGLSTYNMIQRARAEASKNDWLTRLSPQPHPNPTVFVAPIAAGEKVVANIKSDVFKFLEQNYSDALAVEMEGRGVLQAAHANQQVSALIIRGISDLIDGKSAADKSGSQEIAARHASAFAFQVLAKFEIPNQALNSNQTSKETGSNIKQAHSGSGDNVGGDKNTYYDLKGATFGFAGRDYTANIINKNQNINPNSDEDMDLLEILTNYFSNREKPGQHLKSLIAMSKIKIDTAGIDYNLPVRELITSFYVQLLPNTDNYVSFLKVFQRQLPSYSIDEKSFINDLIQNPENRYG